MVVRSVFEDNLWGDIRSKNSLARSFHVVGASSILSEEVVVVSPLKSRMDEKCKRFG
jgi:hypothetical protein